MITIDTKQAKILKFEVAVSHADVRDLQGRFIISTNRRVINEQGYRFQTGDAQR